MLPRLKVNKIFYSIQGEGARVGIPMIFIRLSGCNLKCSFCDTDHKIYKMMSISEIKKKIHWMGIAAGLVLMTTSIFFIGTRFFFFILGTGVLLGAFPFVFTVIRETTIANEKEEMFLEFSRKSS